MSVNTNDYANQLLAENEKLKRERDKLRAEITRRDTAAGERVKAVVKYYAGCKYPLIKVNSLEVVIAGEREDAEELAEFINTIGAQPAVVPPEITPDAAHEIEMLYGVSLDQIQRCIAADAYNQCRADAIALGAQPQKVIVLPEPHAHLIWIQAGRGPDDYWDDVEVSRSLQDRCCDGSERYAVYSEFEVKDMLDAANVPYEVKK